LKIFKLSLNEAPKAHYFWFLLLVQRFTVQHKSNTLPNDFSTEKVALWVQSLCFLFCNNVLVYNISDNCWRIQFAQTTADVAKPPFLVTWGFRFPSMLQSVRSNSYRLLLKTKLWKLQECVRF